MKAKVCVQDRLTKFFSDKSLPLNAVEAVRSLSSRQFMGTVLISIAVNGFSTAGATTIQGARALAMGLYNYATVEDLDGMIALSAVRQNKERGQVVEELVLSVYPANRIQAIASMHSLLGDVRSGGRQRVVNPTQIAKYKDYLLRTIS